MAALTLLLIIAGSVLSQPPLRLPLHTRAFSVAPSSAQALGCHSSCCRSLPTRRRRTLSRFSLSTLWRRRDSPSTARERPESRLFVQSGIISSTHESLDKKTGIRILAEFPGLLVVSKPSGIPFHRVRMHTNTDSDLSSEDDNTISDGEEDDGEELIANMEETFQRSGLEGEEAEEEEESGQRPTSYEDGMMQHLHRLQEEGLIRHQGKLYPIHRLDRVTSGLLLVGTTAESTAALGKAFENHKVQKYYVAISDRWPKKTMGTVSGDMKRSRRSAWMLLRSKVRPAVTKFISTKINKDLRAFLVKPETGRTHQIRVALKSVGAPCLGDSLSVNSSELKTFLNEYGDSERAAASDRTYLHACGLRIDLPQDGGAVKTLQLVLRPTDGHIFQTQEFADAWESYLVPAMMRDAVVTDGSSGHEGDRSPSPSISSPPRHLARFDVNDDLGPILKF